uniref:Deoxyribonuclease gamma-like n=1 Tax=Pundamilia nyererei TaxID=303518 RepID=A0A3B4F1U9_9CICH
MKIAAFNVKNLGMKKVNNDNILKNLIKVNHSRGAHCDLFDLLRVLIVIKVKSSCVAFFNRKNKYHPFEMLSSEPIGRNSRKERFVFFYRHDEINVTDYYQYEEENEDAGDEDAFAREPFILRFDCPTTVVQDLVLIPVHTKPEDTLKELDELHDVVEDIRKKWKNDVSLRQEP